LQEDFQTHSQNREHRHLILGLRRYELSSGVIALLIDHLILKPAEIQAALALEQVETQQELSKSLLRLTYLLQQSAFKSLFGVLESEPFAIRFT
jgi:hypothetical protein